MGGRVVAAFLARHYGIGFLALLDAVSPGAALGYGIGRLGCFLAGDGDYGIPTSLPWGMSFPHGLVPTYVRVHPTPIYEFMGAAVISLYLWNLGRRSSQHRIPAGQVFAEYLLLTGLARFLVEFIRRNPRGWLGLTNAQQVAVVSMVAGALLLLAGITKASAVLIRLFRPSSPGPGAITYVFILIEAALQIFSRATMKLSLPGSTSINKTASLDQFLARFRFNRMTRS